MKKSLFRKYFFLFLICCFYNFLSINTMEVEYTKEEEIPAVETEKKVARFKKITHAPEFNIIVPQGRVQKSSIFLDFKTKEVFTQATFEELINEAHSKKLPFILALVFVAGGKNNTRTASFYSALPFNAYLQQSISQNRYNVAQDTFKNDVTTNQQIIGEIQYFTIDSLEDKFEYLGSDFDLFMGDKEVHDFMSTYFIAAITGAALSQFNLGYMFYKGLGVSQDDKKAFKWYRKAANKGLDLAQNNLGFMYEKGLGIEQDYKKAFEWYSKAAEQGYALAQFNVGNALQKGRGVEKNLELARDWFAKAAEQGNAEAQKRLEQIKEIPAQEKLEQETSD